MMAKTASVDVTYQLDAELQRRVEAQAAEIREQRRQLDEASREIDALRAQLEGDIPRATAWLQRKVWRQRLALGRLNKRVVAQRFWARLANELGRLPTYEEFLAAKNDAEAWQQAALEAEVTGF
jgi:hypothetical protein